MKHIPRLYIKEEIVTGREIFLSEERRHHIFGVLRISPGCRIDVFNNISGEWQGELKNNEIITPLQLIRPPLPEPGANIACALINPHKFAFMIEKITELGIKEITPIITEYTQYKDFNIGRITKIAIQACEQSRRLSIPIIHQVVHLTRFLESFPKSSNLLIGNENKRKIYLKECLAEDCTFLIGPEGGFSEAENELFLHYDFIKQFYFGRNILRSETAAIAFTASWAFRYL